MVNPIATIDQYVRRSHIAYFSMEIALRSEIHTYSGGLGVLAGDTARSCADLEIPAVFVSLVSRAGYLRQTLNEHGDQIDNTDPWDPSVWAEPLGAMVAVQIEGRHVWIRAWLYQLSCPLGHGIPVILLDTDLEQNEAEDRLITHHLYGGDDAYRLKQEIVLGIGGERMLRALGFEIRTYHLNEGHAALLTLSLLRRYANAGPDPSSALHYDLDAVKERCVFTTHTPVEAGHDRFDYRLVDRVLGTFVETEKIRALAGDDSLNMTRLALNLSGYINGVARKHALTANSMFPGYHVHAITNGIHVPTWAHGSFAGLFQTIIPNWGHEPEWLARADQLPDKAVWNAHREAKRQLLVLVSDRTGVQLDLDVPLLGFARRITGYKRPDLLFSDSGRLSAINRSHPFQVVFAGKAHPRDAEGKQLISRIKSHMDAFSGQVAMAFLADYDLDIARALVAGVDVWLNTPLPPMEASGTSGMKAALNGVLNLSSLDGWWVEGCIEGVTGWAIGREDDPGSMHASLLYDKLERVVLPLYYKDRDRWIWMMKQAISRIASQFNSQRMMRRYATEAYLR